jgi:chorismate synthase
VLKRPFLIFGNYSRILVVNLKLMSNSCGKLFTVTSFGESHGKCIGVVVDGCPAGLALVDTDFQTDLDRRRAGNSPASTPRKENDKAEILSGVLNGFTTGAPLCLIIKNENVNDEDYKEILTKMRPGHADFTAYEKYGGFNDWRGGGRFSGRITAGFVMAGSIAKKLLDTLDIKVAARAVEIGGIAIKEAESAENKKVQAAIAAARQRGDSLGGIIEGTAVNVPVGLGEPVFDTLDGELAKTLLAIPAVKGVEFGAGFNAARLKGSENNDPFTVKGSKVITKTNNSGGILGGISNGMPLIVRVAVKPTASIALKQQTIDIKTRKSTTIEISGRHDACIVPRAVPVVEAMMAVTLCDFAMRAGLIPVVIEGKKS